jgi:chaperonin GroEL (HSP60 family)
MRKRIALLQNSMATLYIGGYSEQEKNTDKFLLEDAVSACKSALKYGYIYGGNLIIPHIIYNLKKDNDSFIFDLDKKYPHVGSYRIKELMNCIYAAFSESFKTVLRNFYQDKEANVLDIFNKCLRTNKIYNLKTHSYENMTKTHIINSTQTEIEIMNTVISIIGLVATSNQFISLNIK